MSEADHYYVQRALHRYIGALSICSRPVGQGDAGVALQAVSDGNMKKAATYILDHGHSWIAFEPFRGETETWSTWIGKGVVKDLDKEFVAMYGKHGAVSRTMDITIEEERRLRAYVERATRLGTKAWKEEKPCSDFARDCWRWVTGERLHDRGLAEGLLKGAYSAVTTAIDKSTPNSLAASIVQANRNSREYARGPEI